MTTYQTNPPDYYCLVCGHLIGHTDVFFPYCSKEHAEAETEDPKRIKLYAKFINHQMAAWAALFELITGTKPPKVKEILAVMSGH